MFNIYNMWYVVQTWTRTLADGSGFKSPYGFQNHPNSIVQVLFGYSIF